jgi:hypothetical protein
VVGVGAGAAADRAQLRDGAGHGSRLFRAGGCGWHRLAVTRRLERRGTGSQVVRLGSVGSSTCAPEPASFMNLRGRETIAQHPNYC